MDLDDMDLIVGAGVCGLRLATRLAAAGRPGVVLEKSRGVGGRMATRRATAARFDHGAQFYKMSESGTGPLADLHRQWLEAGLVREWWTAGGVARFVSPEGMTALAKFMAQKLNIQLNARALRLNRGEAWEVAVENSSPLRADRVVLTCPLPQALDLLRSSQISFPPALAEVTYAKALVALVSGGEFCEAGVGYREFAGPVFSIANQARKGLCAESAWTVTMSPEFSETNFSLEDAEVLALITRELRQVLPEMLWKEIQLKRWRYSHPLRPLTTGFFQVAPGLYLCGDGFTRGSLNGAVESADLLLPELLGNAP